MLLNAVICDSLAQSLPYGWTSHCLNCWTYFRMTLFFLLLAVFCGAALCGVLLHTHRQRHRWLDAIPSPACLASRDGRILRANQAWIEGFGAGGDDPLTAIAGHLQHPDSLEPWGKAQSADPAWHGHKLFPGTQGTNLLIASAPIDGRPNQRIWTALELTAEPSDISSKIDNTLAIGKLAGGVAHDFKNFLTTILGNLSMLEAAASEDERQECVQDAMAAALLAADMTEQLMGVSGETRLRSNVTSSRDLLRSAERLLRSSMPFNLELEIAIPDDLWSIQVDRTQMERVFLNLGVNAIHAMPDGGTLKLQARNLSPSEDPQGREMVEFLVEDEGIGMSASVLSRIFEPYFSTKGKEPGKVRGLGLYISYTIVERLKGSIRCDSQEGNGTRFYVRLPRAAALPDPEVSTVSRRPDTHRLLVVDDESVFRRITAELLGEHGFRVDTACDGQEALKFIAANVDQIDLILLDLKMPVLSGSKVFRMLRERGINTPVVVVSGVKEYASRFEREAGGRPSAMVMKPFDLQVLLKTVQDVLGNEPTMRN